MTSQIKITQLTDIGSANLSVTTLLPVVNMSGVPTTQKTTLGNLANVILSQSGGNYAPVAVANLSYSVTNAAQPNITSVGTLTTLTVSGNVNLGSVTNVRISGGSAGQILSTDGNGNLSWVSDANSTYGNSNVVTLLAAFGSNTITTTGNVSAGQLIGNGHYITNLPGINVAGQVNYAAVANSVAGGNVSGEVAFANTANNVAGINVTGFVANANVANTAYSVSASNVSGLGNISTINLDGNASNVLRGNGSWGPDNSGNTGNIIFSGSNISTNVLNANLSINGNGPNSHIVVTANGYGWTFEPYGNFGIPGGTSLGSFNANNATGFNVGSNNQFQIRTQDGNVYDWYFTSGGNFVTPGHILPDANITYDLGSSTQRWKDLWIANSTIYLGDLSLSVSNTGEVATSQLIDGGEGIGGISYVEWTTSNTLSIRTDDTSAFIPVFESLKINDSFKLLTGGNGLVANTVISVSNTISQSTPVSGFVDFTIPVDSSPVSNVFVYLFNLTRAPVTEFSQLTGNTINLGNAVLTANGNTLVVNSIEVTNGNVGTIGNIASINLTGSNSNVLYGNGVFAPASGGGNANIGSFTFANTTMSTPDEDVMLIQTTDNNSLLRTQMRFDPNLGRARMAARSAENNTNYTNTSWTIGEYTGQQVNFVDAPALVAFLNTGAWNSGINKSFSINGGNRLTYQGYSAGGNNATVYTDVTADPDPTTVTSIDFFYQLESYFDIDEDDGDMGIYASGLTIRIDNDQTEGPDIFIRSGDDITLQAKDMSLGSEREGGDINIYAGDGSGDDGAGNSSSSGGDIQIYSGVGGDGNTGSGSQGGTLRLRAGEGGVSGVTNVAGQGGFVEIWGGDGGPNNGDANLGASGGYVDIQAGDTNLEGTNGGNVSIRSGAGGANAIAGNVEIITPASGLGSGGTWTFDGNGNLALPTNGSIIVDGGDGVIGPVSDDLVISWDNEEIRLVSVQASIEMQADAAFRVQTNYDGANALYASRWEFTNNEIVNISNNFGIVSEAGNLNLSGGRDGVNSGNTTISAVDTGVAVSTWTFDNTGNLTLPGNSFAVNYANGTPVSIGGGGNTGNVTFSNITVQGDNNGLNLSAGPDYTSNLAFLQVRSGDVPSHIHLDTGNNSAYDLILGDDQNYVQVSSTGNILLSAYDSNTAQYTWTLDYNGNLILAGGNSVIFSTANSSLDPLNPNVSTMTLTPDANYNSQVLVLDPTAPGHIHLRAHAFSNIDEPAANIFLGGEATSFEVTQGANNDARIHSGSNTWTFGNDGNLVTPGLTGTYIKSAPGGYMGLAAIDDGGDQPAQLVSINSNSGLGTTAISAYANNAMIQANINGDIKTWNFDNTGNLTLPGNTFAVNYANGTQVSLGGGTPAGSNNQIQYNSNGAFAASGNYTFTDTVGGGTVTVGNELNLLGNGTIGTANGNLNIQPAGNVVVTTSIYSWVYNLDGTLSLPTSTYGYAQLYTTGANLYLGNSGNPINIQPDGTISSNANVSANVGLFNDLNLNNAGTNAFLYTDSNRNIYDTQFGYDSATDTMSGGNISLTGNITATNIGNISGVNLDSNVSNVLLGNGSFGPPPALANAVFWTSVPVSNTSPGTPGQIAYDSGGNLYFCYIANNWAKGQFLTSW